MINILLVPSFKDLAKVRCWSVMNKKSLPILLEFSQLSKNFGAETKIPDFFDLAGYGSLEETFSCQYVSCFLQGLPFLDTAVVGKTSKPAYSKSERRVLHSVSC